MTGPPWSDPDADPVLAMQELATEIATQPPVRFYQCHFCLKPVNPDAEDTYKQVCGWVGGPKSDGMVLRKYTNNHAHEACVKKAKAGQPPDQGEFDFD